MGVYEVEDRILIEAVLSGDLEAFGPLMDRYYAMVYRLCLNMSGNAADAQELAHDSFVEAYLKLGQLHDPERFGGWLKTLALNLCRMWYRHNSHRCVELTEEHVGVLEDDIEDPSIYAKMSYGLSTLPPSQRLVLVLHYYERLSYEEVATFLEVPKGTVMSRLHRARQALREVIEQMTEHEEIPAVPDERFKEVVRAEIAILLKIFQDEPTATERLTVILRKLPERLIDLIIDAKDTEMLRNLAVLLPHLGADAVDSVLDCCFSENELMKSSADDLLKSYAMRCGTIPQREGMNDMSSRECYLLLDRLIAHSADDQAKGKVLLMMMEACDESAPSVLLTNALLCYEEAAFPLLMDRFLTGSSGKQSSKITHALVRTGARFCNSILDLMRSGIPEKQAAALAGYEAIARSLSPVLMNGESAEQFLNDLRISEKWPPLRIENIGNDLLADMTHETASLVTSGPADLRSQAIRVLGYLKACEYSDVIRAYLEDANIATRLAAIFALSEIGDTASSDALISRAKNGDGVEKAAALTALGRLHIEHAEHVMVELTGCEEEQVREAAVVALGEIGTISSRVVLQELMHGGDRKMQKIAAKAIYGGVRRKKPELSEVGRKLAEKRRKVSPVAMISPDAVLRFGVSEVRSYDERDLTEQIARVCSDHCATRRYMIELGLMSRSNGVYEFTESGKCAWRVEQFICERYLARNHQQLVA